LLKILQIAAADRNFNTLMKILKGSALEETLSGLGPFTILAPVNIAFEKLGLSALTDLQKQVRDGNVSNLLTYHVLGDKRMVKDFRDGQKLKTISGKELQVELKNGEVRINGAKILSRDRQGSNGVIHAVDAVNISLPISSNGL
jgi:uncharacterized surface protein with fasciclin (FAS1) repeats